jgi:acetolactate synthase-1/2/3 large subunit
MTNVKTKLSDVIFDSLVEAGAGAFFVFTGGAISHIIDSVSSKSNEEPPYYCFQNEQAAAFAAEAFSRTNSDGKLGVTLTTSGPGASNLISGIAGAWFDCIPAIYVTGQVRTHELGIGKGRLQGGFQELDIVSMVSNITKYAKTLTNPNTVRDEILRAVLLARSGRPGPVLIDIPMDLQYEYTTVFEESSRLGKESYSVDSPKSSKHLVKNFTDKLDQELHNSKKPLLLVGGGVRHSGSAELLKDFVLRSNLPSVSTYAAIDILGSGDSNYLGPIGQFGARLANEATGLADLVIVLGSRFAQKQLGNSPQDFAPNARIIAINVDDIEMNSSPRPVDFVIKCDIKLILMNWKPIFFENSDWWKAISESSNLELDSQYDVASDEKVPLPNPYQVADITLKAIKDKSCILILDVGQNVVASVQGTKFPPNVRVISSWGNSPMGYSLPAAIGACIADKSREIVCVIGDGGFQVNIQELQTIVKYKLPIKVILWNNHGYVTIHEYQDGNLEGRYEASDLKHGYSHPNFVEVCDAYKIPTAKFGYDLTTEKLEEALFGNPGAIVIEVEVDPSARLTPSVKGKNPIHLMSI